MRTRALGGAEDPPPAASSDPGGSLRPGTFSAFEEPADAPMEAPVVEGMGTETATAVAKRKPTATEPTPTPMTGPLELPMANRRLWLLIAALIAGAVTALLIILALSFLGSEEESSPAPLQMAPAASEEPTATTETEAAPDDEETAERPQMPLPEAPDPPETETETEAAEATPSRRRRRRPRRAATMASSESAAAPAPWAGAAEPASPLEQARSALTAGDPERCLELLRRAGASPGVLRLRGDCHLRAGDRSEAVKSYERFCRAHPDHSDIPRIRAILERHGGHCR
jgi:hypothetical protein